MKTIETENKNGRMVYIAFSIVGLILLFSGMDYSFAGVFLSLALIFNPFPNESYPEFSLPKKLLVVGQMLLAIGLIGASLFGLVAN